MKLNLGCGRRPMEGYVNVDARPGEGVDVVWDLQRAPWPFPTASVERIRAHAILEHLQHWEVAVLESARVLRSGGPLDILVPYGFRGITSPYHVRAFTDHTFDMFAEEYRELRADLQYVPPEDCPTLEVEPPYFQKVLVEKRHYYPFAWHLAQRAGDWVYRLPFSRTWDLRVVLQRNRRPWEGAPHAETD